MLSEMRMGNPQDFFILTVVTVIFAEVSKNLYCFKRCKWKPDWAHGLSNV